MTLLKEIEEYKKSELKDKYLSYIKDEKNSIEERWAIFVKAPEDWKNTQSYVVHFNMEKNLKDKEILWYDDFYIEKHESVNMKDMIDSLEEDLERFEKSGWTKDLVQKLKIEILEKNLHSFEYDW